VPQRRFAGVGVAGALLFAVISGACSGGDANGGHDAAGHETGTSTATTAAEVTVEVQAQGVRFKPNRIEIPAGKVVVVRLVNADAVEHDLQVDGLEVEVLSGGVPGHSANTLAVHTAAHGSAEITVHALETGIYDIYCTVTGHKEAGMVGTLVVV
jgi:uncharacterized cupredoxin-like copper-binding protein